ncbi:hypothetical protein [Pandoravirus japonicus]|uniref:Uncharacterized protein n=1 Tax=Pandoravirus japonicus TaxID=2823154 RepID=A0A811BQ22_9VIRU|nr:hypothetical protein [Pandoravirus japonicus]
MDTCTRPTFGAHADDSDLPLSVVRHLSDRCYLGSDTIDRGDGHAATALTADPLKGVDDTNTSATNNGDNDDDGDGDNDDDGDNDSDGVDDLFGCARGRSRAPSPRAHRHRWSQRHRLPTADALARGSHVRLVIDVAVPMRLYVRAPSPAAMAAVASLACRSPSSLSPPASLSSSSPTSSPDLDRWRSISPLCGDAPESPMHNFFDDDNDVNDGSACDDGDMDVCATAPGIDPNLLHAPAAMIDSEAYVRGRAAYVAVQHEALQAHRERGVRLLGERAGMPGMPMDLSSLLDLYKHRLAVAHVQSLRRRVVALDALYDHTMRGRCAPPESVRAAASTSNGVELAAAWYGQWASTAVPLQTPDDADGDRAQHATHPRCIGGGEAPSRPVAWAPVAGNTGVPLPAGAPLFYVGVMRDPLACPVHRDADGRLTCPPVGCAHRDLLAGVMSALGDARALDALLAMLVAADADTIEFALALRSTVNAALDGARRRWGGESASAVQREPVDLFSEFPVDAFVLARMGADGALLPHVIAVAPRLDIELCL